MLLNNKDIQELILCALEQGYGEDLKPLFKYPVLTLETYLELKRIYLIEHGKKRK